jgi:hypothetical protein
MYKLVKSITTGQINSVVTEEGNIRMCIPFDQANTDFVEYNKWLALGNQPLPPDEPTLP